jgi:F-type H+-transporting ATPase subunit b
LIFQVISFLVFLFIINRIMFRPLRKVMNERETHIENVQKDISAAENRFADLSHQVKAQEKSARNEAFKQREQLEAAGSRQAGEIISSARQEIDALRAEAQKEVDTRISEARKHIQKESENLAQAIIETVLHRGRQS